MDWSPQQQNALSAVQRWMTDKPSQVLRLFGYAGTGKTTLAKEFALGLGSGVCFGAFTGKAAHVLNQKGCPGATTIHKLIYRPQMLSREALKEYQDELAEIVHEMSFEGATPEQISANPLVIEMHQQIRKEEENLKRARWSLNLDSDLRRAKLVVIDEVSMVDARMGEDLLSFGVPILVLGDPAQLPPVKGEGFFTKDAPDIMLTEIHRQSKENPILQMAFTVRTGGKLEYGTYGDSRVISRDKVVQDEVMAADQILVGINKTRKQINSRIREIRGMLAKSHLPIMGDKLVCLRNNHEKGLLNGSLWMVEGTAQLDGDDGIDLDLRSHDNGNATITTAHQAYFRGEEPPFYEIRDRDCFDFGYAMTVHKSQGSQWDNVYIFDQSASFRQDSRKWLYTAITRAAKTVTVVV